jgi:lipopolysaccharide/colanic/teichoic acid biosynthesis glycosyltransferase
MREQVMPGITGLWQVEARDNPSFEAYRRLDLFYVENWSMTLDLMILIGTIEQVLARVFRARRDHRATTGPAPDTTENNLTETNGNRVAPSGAQ